MGSAGGRSSRVEAVVVSIADMFDDPNGIVVGGQSMTQSG
jgi:hypothetical protein